MSARDFTPNARFRPEVEVIPAVLPAGSLFGGYRILSVLGRGGMGLVYKAQDEKLGRIVAVKVIARELLTDDRFMRRFTREARAGAAISHPNITTIYQIGEDSGTPFLVFEFVPGGTLAQRLRERGRLPWREAASIGASVAQGLGAVHAAGLVHRDLKPENVLFDARGQCKLADFGLVGKTASSNMTATGGITEPGEIMGTVLYMSPEQADGRPADARADLYSLGALLYALTTGAPPFQGSGISLLKKHLMEKPVPLRAHVPDVSPAFEQIVLRLLEKRAEDRGGAADVVASELEGLRVGEEPRRPGGQGVPLGVRLAFVAALIVGATAILWSGRPGPAKESVEAVAAHSSGSVTVGVPPPSPPAKEPPYHGTRRTTLRAVLGRPDGNHAGGVTAVAIALNGHLGASAGQDGFVRVFDPATQEELASVHPSDESGYAGQILALAFTPDGRRILTGGGDGNLRLLDSVSRREITHVKAGAAVLSVAVSFDGTRALAASLDGRVTLWSLSPTGLELLPTSGVPDALAVAFSPAPTGEHALLGGRTGTVSLWDSSSGAVLVTRSFQTGEVRGVAFAPDGKKAASVSTDGSLVLFSLDAVARSKCVSLGTGLHAVAFTPDGHHVVAGGEDHTTRVVDVSTEAETRALLGHTLEVWAVAVTGDLVFSGSRDGAVRRFSLTTGRETPAWRSHRGEVLSLAISPNAKQVLSGSQDGSARLWDIARGTELSVLQVRELVAVAWPQAAGFAVTGSRDGSLTVWDTTRIPWTAQLLGTHAELNAVGASPDGKVVVSATRRGEVALWETSSRRVLARRTVQSGTVWNVASFSPDGARILVAGAHPESPGPWTGTIVVLDRQLDSVARPGAHQTSIASAGWSPDGLLLVSGPDDGTVEVRAAETGDPIPGLVMPCGAGQRVWSTGFLSDRRVLASSFGSLHVFDLVDGLTRSVRSSDEISIERGDFVRCVDTASDGRSFVAGTARGVVLVFEVEK